MMPTLDVFMRKFCPEHLIKYDNIKNEITIDARTQEEYSSEQFLKYNIPIINKREHKFLHMHKPIAGIVVFYGFVRNRKNIKEKLLEISKNKEYDIIIGCSKGRLRSPALWLYARSLGINCKVIRGGIRPILDEQNK